MRLLWNVLCSLSQLSEGSVLVVLPNFLIGGGCASGCSQLTAALKQHPDIFLPRYNRPEPHYFYFSHKYVNPLSSYSESVFANVEEQRAIGETSSSNLHAPHVPGRIWRHLPGVRLIFQIRNPVERAYAGYRATAFHGLESVSFSEAVEMEDFRRSRLSSYWAEVDPFNYTGRSKYGESLMRYLEFFPREQILILKSEETRIDPQKNFRKCFEFLELESNFVPTLPPSFTSRSVINLDLQKELRAYFGKKFDILIDVIERDQTSSVGEFLEGSGDWEMWTLLIGNLKDHVSEIEDETYDRLLEIFAPDLEIVREIVKFQIEDWLTSPHR